MKNNQKQGLMVLGVSYRGLDRAWQVKKDFLEGGLLRAEGRQTRHYLLRKDLKGYSAVITACLLA